MVRLEQLGPEHARPALDLCNSNPEHCVFIAGWIHDGGLCQSAAAPKGWLLAELTASRELAGLLFISATGIALPVLRSESAFEQLGALVRANPGMIRVLVGARRQIQELWGRLARLGMVARAVRDQLAYAVTRDRFRPVDEPLPVAGATVLDLDDVVRASAAMAREEANDDPQARNPTLFRERIQARLGRGRDFLYRAANGELAFKANVAALSPIGGQLEGVYTPASMRRQQFGIRGTSAITEWILERAHRTVLLVNDDNAPARDLYEKLGFVETYESRTIIAV